MGPRSLELRWIKLPQQRSRSLKLDSALLRPVVSTYTLNFHTTAHSSYPIFALVLMLGGNFGKNIELPNHLYIISLPTRHLYENTLSVTE